MDGDRVLSVLCKEKDFCEARVERTHSSGVRFKDGELQVNSGSEECANVRVFRNGCWGFASGGTGELEALLAKAKSLASAGGGKLKLGEREAMGKGRGKGPGEGLGVEKLSDLCGELVKGMESARVTNRSIMLFEEREEEEYYNSLGDEVREETLVMYGRFSAVGKKGGRVEEGRERFGSLEKWDEKRLFGCAGEAKRKCEESLDAKPPEKGEFAVVMDPALSGVFAHEAIGHASEADGIIEGTSVLGNKMGEKVGSGLISIWDDPGLKGGFGRYRYDNEGMRGKKVMLLEKGVVSGRMHSAETAAEMGEEPNGHGRAESCSCSPIVRMSNTCIEPGEHEVEELMGMRGGLYLRGMCGGSVDPFTGQFMFRCEEAFRIEGGEAGERIQAVAITGTILETLGEVEGVGRDFKTHPGFCGKEGQSIRVSDGGPHVRVKKMRVG